MEGITPETVPERRYNPKQYSLDEFLARNKLDIRSQPFDPSHFPELNYMVPPDFPIDMRIFKGNYFVEDPFGTSNYFIIVNPHGRGIAEMALYGFPVFRGNIINLFDARTWADTNEWKEWYWLTALDPTPK